MNFDFEELDYSILNENKITSKEVKSWVHCFITNTAPSFDQAKEFFESKDIKVTKLMYEKICKERAQKPVGKGS